MKYMLCLLILALTNIKDTQEEILEANGFALARFCTCLEIRQKGIWGLKYSLTVNRMNMSNMYVHRKEISIANLLVRNTTVIKSSYVTYIRH